LRVGVARRQRGQNNDDASNSAKLSRGDMAKSYTGPVALALHNRCA